jgi:hypothetical protein
VIHNLKCCWYFVTSRVPCLYLEDGLKRVEIVDTGEDAAAVAEGEEVEVQGGPRLGGGNGGFLKTID